jgi:type IV secretion system protein VirB9
MPIPTDRRLRTVVYSPNDVFKFTGHYGYQSAIEFETGEEIQTISIGDSIAWQLTPVGNRLFLKPIEAAADTNMTLITNRRTYFFELHARETDSMRDPRMMFVMRFVYPNADTGNVSSYTYEDPLPDLQREPWKYNLNYSISGEAQYIAPVRIFDDGVWTYFEFARSAPDIPAFFIVDSENKEELVNFRRRDNYIIVERVASRFTLRYGAEVICVFNERMPYTLRQVRSEEDEEEEDDEDASPPAPRRAVNPPQPGSGPYTSTRQ